jgi:integrase
VGRLKFTQAALMRRFAENPNGLAWDADCRPLCSHSNGDGSISLVACYRLANGKVKKTTLGRLTEAPITEFRRQALELSLAARQGRDLVAERKTVATPPLTLGEAYVAYMESLQKRGASPHTVLLNTRNWRDLSTLQARPLIAITRQDCRQVHGELLKRGPTLSNRVLKLLKTIISYAQKRLDLPPIINAVSAVEWHRERGQRKSVATSELAAFWEATGRIQSPIRRCYWRFLCYCGARREEVASIRLADIGAESVKLAQAKGGRFYTIPITPQLREIIKLKRRRQPDTCCTTALLPIHLT